MPQDKPDTRCGYPLCKYYDPTKEDMDCPTPIEGAACQGMRPYITEYPKLPRLAQCHDCQSYIVAGEGVKHYETWFHVKCFNRYAHYYGLDKPID